MNVSGLKVSFYWAKFSPEYLTTIRFKGLDELKKFPYFTLHHSKPRSLLDPQERDYLLEEFVSIIRCVAEGYGKVGFLRRDKHTPVHRDLNSAGDENTRSVSSDTGDADDGESDNSEADDGEADDNPFL